MKYQKSTIIIGASFKFQFWQWHICMKLEPLILSKYPTLIKDTSHDITLHLINCSVHQIEIRKKVDLTQNQCFAG